MATNFVSDGSDTSGSVSETDTFGGKIKSREGNGMLLSERFSSCWFNNFVRLLQKYNVEIKL